MTTYSAMAVRTASSHTAPERRRARPGDDLANSPAQRKEAVQLSLIRVSGLTATLLALILGNTVEQDWIPQHSPMSTNDRYRDTVPACDGHPSPPAPSGRS